ncbi:MAG: peptidyl-prolyl cis-trans isomerase [Flavobacteriaceae bacterium]|nr:peptidyl-prolyl cis-trans isomerase [Flavobacteriaceae bacterium]
MKNSFYIIICFLFLSSCDYFVRKGQQKSVARVNESYLYEEDIKDLITDETSAEDSTLIVNNYITRWATQQLLIDGAELNISQEKQSEFNKLVDQYRKDLYTKAYVEALVTRDLDENVGLAEAEEYYKNNSETFKLNEELIKLRYIQLDESRSDFSKIKERFRRFNNEDKFILDSISIQFNSYSLNDSIWIKLSQAVNKIPVITPDNKNQLLKKSNFIQLKDSLGVYLMQINDVLLRNETAPLEYVKPTIDQIVINRRKLELIRVLEKDITSDAIKNNQFEIFN